MRLTTLLTIGAVVLATSAAYTISGHSASATSGSQYRAVVRGALIGSARGKAEFGPVANGSSFTVTMGAYDQTDAVVLTRAWFETPAPGTYDVAEAPDSEGFRALFIAGPGERPEGVFRATRGTVTIVSVTPDRITGTFEFAATGFLGADLTAEDRAVTVTGSFSAVRAPQAFAHYVP